MLPLDTLDPLEDLLRMDPLRGYPERAAKAIAELVGASRHAFLEAAPQADTFETKAMVLTVKHHLQAFGAIELTEPRAATGFSADDLRVARWGARVLARQLATAARVRHGDEPGRPRSDIDKAIARLPLTPREREVVALIVMGTSTRGVAEKTKLTVATVHTYLKRIYPKVGVRSRVELVALVTGTSLLS